MQFLFVFIENMRHLEAVKATWQDKQQGNHETSINISHLKANETSHAWHWIVGWASGCCTTCQEHFGARDHNLVWFLDWGELFSHSEEHMLLPAKYNWITTMLVITTCNKGIEDRRPSTGTREHSRSPSPGEASWRGRTDSRGRDSPVKSERWVTLRRGAHQHGGVTRWWRRKNTPKHVGNLKPQKSVWDKRTNARNPLYTSSLHKHKTQNSHCQHSLRNIFWYKTVRPHLSHHYVSWQTALIHWAGPKYQTAPHGRTNGETDPAEQKVGWNATLFNAFNMNEKRQWVMV